MNHIEETEHKVMVLKPANKYQIIRQSHTFKNILIDNVHHHPFLCRAKVCKHHFLRTENNTLQRQDNHSNIYLLFDLLWCQKSIS